MTRALAHGRRRLGAARRRLRDQRGFTLIELLVSSSLMIVVLSAVLFTFEHLLVNSNAATIRYDSQDRARQALDRLDRDLRNVTDATTGVAAIDRSNPDDLIFRTVNPMGPAGSQNLSNVQRVRYCIDNTNPAAEVLYREVQAIPNSASVPSPPSGSGCGPNAGSAAGWSAAGGGITRYADAITNFNGGQSRPVFSYTYANGVIDMIHTDLFVNATTKNQVPETHLSSGVFLRNQDVPPTAQFTAQASSGGYITLDGSASFSPSGQPLTYAWFDGSTEIGTSVVCHYNGETDGVCGDGTPSQQLASGSTHSITLKVFDAAQLEGDAAAQTVTVP